MPDALLMSYSQFSYHFFSLHIFYAEDFSEMARSISLLFLGPMCRYLKFIMPIDIFDIHFQP